MRNVSSLKHLDLFSGIGGFSLGLEATGGFETVAFCDIEKFPRKILKQHWPHVKQYKDIKELTYERLQADGIVPIDIITGGYPCQPFSVAGRKKGEQDKRHLWPEMFRLIRECRPTWVVGENVIGLVQLGLDEVLSDLEGEGYATRTFNIPACGQNAPHIRQRIWIIAYANSNSKPNDTINDSKRRRKLGKQRVDYVNGIHWDTKPNLCGVVNGIPRRMDRLRSLGNSIVPQIATAIGYSILEYYNE